MKSRIFTDPTIVGKKRVIIPEKLHINGGILDISGL